MQIENYRKYKEKTYFEINGYDSLERSVRARGNTGGIYVPKLWIGEKITAVLMGGYDSHSQEKEVNKNEKQKFPQKKKCIKFMDMKLPQKL